MSNEINRRLKELLNYLEESVDIQRQAEIRLLHRRALNWETVERLPLVMSYPLQEDSRFKPFPHREVFDDPEKMLYNELVYAFNTSIANHFRLNDDLPHTIRANFGTVIIASMFGAKVEQAGDNPPWVHNFANLKEFQQVFDCNPLDFSNGWCPKVVERYQFYNEVFKDYPNLWECVKIVLPDLQSSFDTAELIRGSEIFLDMYERMEMLQKLLVLLSTAQVNFAKYLQQYVSDDMEDFCHQHATVVAGNILIRNDSTIMMSPEMYREQVSFHDEFVLKEFGGGGIHSCGNFNHLADEYLKLPSLRCIDFGQPEMNDLDMIYAKAAKRKIPLIRLNVPEEELLSGSVNERFPTGVSLMVTAKSLEHACWIVSEYKRVSK